MDRKQILDKLYTIRWCLNQTPAKVDGAVVLVTSLINELVVRDGEMEMEEKDKTEEPVKDPMDPETPGVDDVPVSTLVVVVGHEKRAPGATFARGGSEYQYNSDIAQRMVDYASKAHPHMKVVKVFRDGIGISGAYKKAASFHPDACIELHFNAHNGAASGSEVLSSMNKDDKFFAEIVLRNICKVFGRTGFSRGVKVLSRGDRGAQTCYGLPGTANCLPEPFFGDNPKEAELADEKRAEYAACLVEAAAEWIRAQRGI